MHGAEIGFFALNMDEYQLLYSITLNRVNYCSLLLYNKSEKIDFMLQNGMNFPYIKSFMHYSFLKGFFLVF